MRNVDTLLARISEKKQLFDSLKPLPPALEKNLYAWHRIALTYSSNAIEGNTLTHQETAMVVEKDLTVGGKSLVEHLEATNHAKAVDLVMHFAAKKKRQLGLADYH